MYLASLCKPGCVCKNLPDLKNTLLCRRCWDFTKSSMQVAPIKAIGCTSNSSDSVHVTALLCSFHHWQLEYTHFLLLLLKCYVKFWNKNSADHTISCSIHPANYCRDWARKKNQLVCLWPHCKEWYVWKQLTELSWVPLLSVTVYKAYSWYGHIWLVW